MHVYVIEYMRFYYVLPTSSLIAFNVIHIFYFGKSTTYWWFYNVFLALQHFLSRSSNRHQTLTSYLYLDTQITQSLSGYGIKSHNQVPNKEKNFLFTTMPKLAQRTIQPYAQNDADNTLPPSLIKIVYQSMKLCTASNPVCTTSMKSITHPAHFIFSVYQSRKLITPQHHLIPSVCQSMKLITHLHLVPQLRKHDTLSSFLYILL